MQWSGQVSEETLRRQRKYARSGVTGIWLLRQPGFLVSQDLPAACIGGSMEDGLRVLLPKHEYMTRSHRDRQDSSLHQVLSPEEFLAAVFDGRFHFGIPEGARIKLDIEAVPNDCVRCKKRMYLVTMLTGNAGPHGFCLRRPQYLAREYPEIREKIMNAIAHRKDVAKVEHSLGVFHTYLRGRCPKCGKWTRGEREFDLFYDTTAIGTIELEMADRWARVSGYNQHWAVWPSQSDVLLDTGQPMSSEARTEPLIERSVVRSSSGPGAEAESADGLSGAVAP